MILYQVQRGKTKSAGKTIHLKITTKELLKIVNPSNLILRVIALALQGLKQRISELLCFSASLLSV